MSPFSKKKLWEWCVLPTWQTSKKVAAKIFDFWLSWKYQWIFEKSPKKCSKNLGTVPISSLFNLKKKLNNKTFRENNALNIFIYNDQQIFDFWLRWNVTNFFFFANFHKFFVSKINTIFVFFRTTAFQNTAFYWMNASGSFFIPLLVFWKSAKKNYIFIAWAQLKKYFITSMIKKYILFLQHKRTLKHLLLLDEC